MSQTGPRVAVVGSGAWGTTMAAHIGRREPVALVCRSADTAGVIAATRRNERRLPGIDLPRDLIATADPSAVASAELVVLAVPSAHLRTVVGALGPVIRSDADVLSLVKGIEQGTLMRPSEVIADAAGIEGLRIAALSGPNLAPEIARRRPASAVAMRSRGRSIPGSRRSFRRVAAMTPAVSADRQTRATG
ncbi:MAG TPA: 2-dehydropantoate 2-reductase N-terminal domain-containing protein, partial [Candidatus Limnocylindrales bacterium]|nr:2-dehydropantoate 2-reductase N-terminal domain-containing protein [Candidatus Limnocylindrales bacterium]